MDDSFFEKHVPTQISQEELLYKSLPDKNTYIDFKHISNKLHAQNTKEYLISALALNKNNKSKTAKYLGISRNTLYIRLKEYDLL